ncbi:MAG: hypothetical protein KU38_11340 [Sulfurovum sp. FS08-3]|nr:MAG: hypothetical protein KU38_11340 [Sulfurovum sp. FS08-3]
MKKLITLSLVASTTLAFASTASDVRYLKTEIENLKAEIATLKGSDTKIKKTLNEVKAHDAKDNIKFSADLRTSVDNISYDMADGTERKKDALYSTRLWLNMAYAPTPNLIFKGQIAYNKAFGATFMDVTGMPQRGFGFDTFDWITNEALTGDELKLRQAYWLYMGDDFFGTGMGWTASVGRRPSTTGFLSNLREDDEEQSPLGHMIDVEFDGASAMLKLGDITGVSGMSFKVCLGQGSTDAAPRLSGAADYAESDNVLDDVKLAGFIFVPYDDGQFQVKTMMYRAWDLPGYTMAAIRTTMDNDPTTNPTMTTMGDMDGAVISVLINGLSDDGYLSDVKLFGSLAWSKTHPNTAEGMLGSADEETGMSYWFGLQAPVPEIGGKFGLEYNHGDEYWRPFTYGEDTMVGSKLAVRGDAIEAYYTRELTKGLSFSVRYTYMDYEYTGSNSFFGTDGMAMKIDDIKTAVTTVNQMGGLNNVMAAAAAGNITPQQANDLAMAVTMAPNVVDEAHDIRAYIRYRF